MSALWSVEYQRKDSDTKECLWVSVDEPKSTARATERGESRIVALVDVHSAMMGRR
jgi:hypothetical protein